MLAAGVFVDELLLSVLVEVLDADLSLVEVSFVDLSPVDLSLALSLALSLDVSLDVSPFVDLLFAPGPRLSFL